MKLLFSAKAREEYYDQLMGLLTDVSAEVLAEKCRRSPIFVQMNQRKKEKEQEYQQCLTEKSEGECRPELEFIEKYQKEVDAKMKSRIEELFACMTPSFGTKEFYEKKKGCLGKFEEGFIADLANMKLD